MDLGFVTGMPENLYIGKFSPKTATLECFSDFVTAHAQQRPEYCFRFQSGHQIRHAEYREILPKKLHFDSFTANFVLCVQWEE